MKTIININTFAEEQVPDDHIECSMCGVYHGPDSYRKSGEGHQSRTNCDTCYNLPLGEFAREMNKLKELKNNPKYQRAMDRFKQRSELFGMSIPVEEMIARLQTLPKGSRVYVAQEGYYAEGKFASVFPPSDKPQYSVNGVDFYEIGHSSQNC